MTDEEWVDDQNELKSMASSFYRDLFTKDNHNRMQPISSITYSILDANDLHALNRDVTLGEVKKSYIF